MENLDSKLIKPRKWIHEVTQIALQWSSKTMQWKVMARSFHLLSVNCFPDSPLGRYQRLYLHETWTGPSVPNWSWSSKITWNCVPLSFWICSVEVRNTFFCDNGAGLTKSCTCSFKTLQSHWFMWCPLLGKNVRTLYSETIWTVHWTTWHIGRSRKRVKSRSLIGPSFPKTFHQFMRKSSIESYCLVDFSPSACAFTRKWFLKSPTSQRGARKKVRDAPLVMIRTVPQELSSYFAPSG